AKPHLLRRRHFDLFVCLPSPEQHVECQRYHVSPGARPRDVNTENAVIRRIRIRKMTFPENIVGDADAGRRQHSLFAVIECQADPHSRWPEEGAEAGTNGRPDLAEPGAKHLLLAQANELSMKPD